MIPASQLIQTSKIQFMMKKKLSHPAATLAVLIAILSPAVVCAQSLSDYLKKAAESNPALQARYQEYLAALEKIPQARALPDPQLTVNMFVSPNGLYMERFMGRQLSEISVMQMLPWSGLREAAQHEATFMARMKMEAYTEARNNLFHEVRSTWYQLYENDRQHRLLEEERVIMQAYEQLALTRYKAGSGAAMQPSASGQTMVSAQTTPPARTGGMNMGSTPTGTTVSTSAGNMNSMNTLQATGSLADVLRIQLQIKDLDTQIQKLQNQQKQLTTRFANLLNTSISEPVVLADTLTEPSLPASIQAMRDSLTAHHPMIKMSRWEEQARTAQMRMNNLMGRPMMGIGLSYMIFNPRMDEVMNMPMGGENMLMPMVTLTLPVYRKKYQALQSETARMQMAASRNAEAARLELENEMERLLNLWEDNGQTLKLLSEQIILTQHIVQLLVTAYENGSGNMEELLQQRQALINYKKQQLNTLTNQHILVSALHNLAALSTY